MPSSAGVDWGIVVGVSYFESLQTFLRSSHSRKQLARFLSGGLVSVAIDYLGFALLVKLGAHLFVAATVSYVVGFAVSFTLNKVWVFGAVKGAQHHKTHLQATLYFALFLFNITFTNLFIYFAHQQGLSPYIGKACTILLITCWNFVLYKKVIFRLKG